MFLLVVAILAPLIPVALVSITLVPISIPVIAVVAIIVSAIPFHVDMPFVFDDHPMLGMNLDYVDVLVSLLAAGTPRRQQRHRPNRTRYPEPAPSHVQLLCQDHVSSLPPSAIHAVTQSATGIILRPVLCGHDTLATRCGNGRLRPRTPGLPCTGAEPARVPRRDYGVATSRNTSPS
jgi:hypothetical protein